jgi:hypothetical protein
MQYQLSVISYFDILGMRQLLTDSGNDPSKIEKLLSLCKVLSDPDQGSKDAWGWQFVNFSDLIVRAVPIMSDANKQHRIGLMFHELSDICHIQANLIARGVMVRGSMTVGNIAIEHELVFGEGLARAYLQESTKARFPRIIVDRRLMEMFRSLYLLRSHAEFAEEWSYVRPYLGRDSEGTYFVDYLNYVQINEKPDKYAKFLAKHRDVILEKRRQLRGDRRKKEFKSRAEKVGWLMSYHNSHIERVADPEWGDATLNREDLIIPQKFLL